MLKMISVSLLSLGLATGAMAQTAGSSSSQADDGSRVGVGKVNPPVATDGTTTNSTRTNCAPNLNTTTGSGNQPNKDGQATTAVPGGAGTNTNGQSSNC